MIIIEKEVDSLIPYKYNNKIHDEIQIERIANSIKEFGFLQPIVIDKNNVIIVGHWRLIGAKRLWLDKVPCILVDNLTKEQIKKYRILDNKLNESDWDLNNLKIELEELPNFDFGDLKFDTLSLFPQLEIPDILPIDDNKKKEKEKDSKICVRVFVDQDELELFKKDLTELWYTNFKY